MVSSLEVAGHVSVALACFFHVLPAQLYFNVNIYCAAAAGREAEAALCVTRSASDFTTYEEIKKGVHDYTCVDRCVDCRLCVYVRELVD